MKFSFATIFFALIPGLSLASSLAEQYAQGSAKGANSIYQKGLPNDGVTRSARAYAQGSTVVHEIVLAIKPNVTEQELQTWRSSTRSEVVPGNCNHLKNDEFFNLRGFQVRYRYLNTAGAVLDDFTVNKAACSTY